MSGLEFNYYHLIDKSPNVKRWGSEVIHVPYLHPWKTDKNDNRRMAKYWVDVYLESTSGQKYMIELKPNKEIKALNESKAPKMTKNKKKQTYIHQVQYYTMNQAKWQAASKYAHERGWNFICLGEDDYSRIGTL